MRPSFRPSSIHIMLIVLPQIASKRGLKIGIILFVYIHIKLRAPLSSLCHARIIKMREQCQLICSNRSLKIRICIVVIIWIKHSGVRVHQIIGDRRCFCCRGAAVSCRTIICLAPHCIRAYTVRMQMCRMPVTMVMITSQPTLILIVTMTSISICTSRMSVKVKALAFH